MVVTATYGGKVIHTFLNSGTFTAPGSFDETVEYVMVGGGGGGGADCGGGGGAGGYITGSTPITGPSPLAVVIGAGGQGGSWCPLTPHRRDRDMRELIFWNSLTAPYGGGGGYGNSTGANGNQAGGGSGGGGGGGVVPQEVVVLADLKEMMEVGMVVHPLDMVVVVAVALVVLVMVVQPTLVVTVVMEHRFQQPSEILLVTLPLETLGMISWWWWWWWIGHRWVLVALEVVVVRHHHQQDNMLVT